VAEETPQEEKTEEPTQKRLEDARLEGNVPRSVELASMMVLLTGVVALFFYGSVMWNSMEEAGSHIFVNVANMEIGPHNLNAYTEAAVFFLLRVMGPLFILLMVVGILTGVTQSGPNFTWKPLMPKASKMNPIKGIKRVFFSSRAIVEMVKSVLKVIAVAALSAWTISGMFGDYILLLDQEVGQFFIYLLPEFMIVIKLFGTFRQCSSAGAA